METALPLFVTVPFAFLGPALKKARAAKELPPQLVAQLEELGPMAEVMGVDTNVSPETLMRVRDHVLASLRSGVVLALVIADEEEMASMALDLVANRKGHVVAKVELL